MVNFGVEERSNRDIALFGQKCVHSQGTLNFHARRCLAKLVSEETTRKRNSFAKQIIKAVHDSLQQWCLVY